MEVGLVSQNLTEDGYEEYIDKIVNIFRLSSKKSSILFDMKINNYQADIKLSILNQNGERERFHDVILQCDQNFYQKFLVTLVKRIYFSGDIATSDIVHLSDSDLVTFRMITSNNDLFSVDGLSIDDANHLVNISKVEEDEKKTLTLSNHHGNGSLWIFLLLVVIILILLVIIFFVISR